MSEFYEASMRSMLKDFRGRRMRVFESLSLVKNQDSAFAEAHRRLIAAYDRAIAALVEEPKP